TAMAEDSSTAVAARGKRRRCRSVIVKEIRRRRGHAAQLACGRIRPSECAGNPLVTTSVQGADGLHAHPSGLSGHHVLRNDRDHEVRLVISPLAQLADLAINGGVVEAY